MCMYLLTRDIHKTIQDFLYIVPDNSWIQIVIYINSEIEWLLICVRTHRQNFDANLNVWGFC